MTLTTLPPAFTPVPLDAKRVPPPALFRRSLHPSETEQPAWRSVMHAMHPPMPP